MSWKNRYMDDEIKNDHLSILLNDPKDYEKKKVKKLKGKDLFEIINFIRNKNITQLTLIQTPIAPKIKSGAQSYTYTQFFQQLLTQCPTLESLTIGVGSSFSCFLSQDQLKQLATAVQSSNYLQHFELKHMPDTQATTDALANMLAQSRSLITFTSYHTDDSYGFKVLKAALQKTGTFKKLNLPITVMPYDLQYRSSVATSDFKLVANASLEEMCFEEGKVLKPAASPSPATAMTRVGLMPSTSTSTHSASSSNTTSNRYKPY